MIKKYNNFNKGLLVEVAKTKATPSDGQVGGSIKKRISNDAAPETHNYGSDDGSAMTKTSKATTGHQLH